MLKSFQNKLLKLQGVDMGAIFIRVMAMPEVTDSIIRLNQDQMYVDGIDSKGASLGEYSPHTKAAKYRIGAESGHITIYDEGDFYASMVLVEKDNDTVVIAADMQKPDQNLEDRWPDALGLTEDSIDKLRPIFNKYFLAEYRKEVNAILYGSKAA